MSRLAKHTLSFSLLTLLSRITGLVRVSAFAAVLGSGRFDDAYQLANTIPNIIYEFVMGGLLSAILIPLLVEAQQRHGKDSSEAWRIANLLLGYVGLALAVLSAIAVVLSPQIVATLTALGSGIHAEQSRQLATYFFRFFAPQMFFYGLNAVFMAILNSRGIFAITAAAPIVNNLVVIGTVLLFHAGYIGITGLAVGTTAGIASMALCQLPWLMALRMPLRPQAPLRDPLLRSVLALGLPVLAVGAANLVATIVRSNFLYTVGSGFTTYTFCFQLIMMPYGIIAVSIATVLYPVLAEHAATGNKIQFLEALVRGIKWTSFVLVPIVVIMSALAEPIVRVVFERGQFSYANTRFTAQFLAIYAISILPYSLVVLATRAFYAQKDTWTVMWINIAGVILTIAVTVVAYRYVSILAIPLAAVITYVTTTGLSLDIIRRRLSTKDGMRGLRGLWKMGLAGVLMASFIVTLDELSKPVVTVLERGERFPGHVSAKYDSGAVLVIHNSQELRDFWQFVAKDDTPPPSFDFERNRVIVVFAPRGSTSATLSVSKVLLDERNKSAELQISVRRSSVSCPSALEEPSYLVAVVRAPIQNAITRFEISQTSRKHSWRELLQIDELWRLGLISTLGAFLYLMVSWLLRIEEAHWVLERCAKLWGKRVETL